MSTSAGRGTRLLTLTVLLGAVLTALAAGPASAHDRLVGTDPADGSSVARTPAALVLTFDEPPVALGTRVVVTGPSGSAASGAAELVGSTVRQPLVPGAPPGTYTVEWRVTSDDGHPVSGTFTFTSAAAGAGTPAPAASSAIPTAPEPVAAAGPPAWAWVLVSLLVLAAAATALVGLRRRRGPTP